MNANTNEVRYYDCETCGYRYSLLQIKFAKFTIVGMYEGEAPRFRCAHCQIYVNGGLVRFDTAICYEDVRRRAERQQGERETPNERTE